MANEPASHVTLGATVPSKSSVAVTVTATVAPETTSSRVAGVKVITGGTVSGSGAGLTRAKNVPVPLLPGPSRAVAVHLSITVRVPTLTTGAV